MKIYILYLLLSAVAGLVWLSIVQARAHKAYRAWADAKIDALTDELRAAETAATKGDKKLNSYLRECG